MSRAGCRVASPRVLFLSLLAFFCFSFLPSRAVSQEPATAEASARSQRLPSGKLQADEIMKADHEKSLKDIQEILKLAEDLKSELEKTEGQVLSLGAIKKTEQIEKLAHNIRGRMKRIY